MSKYEVHVFDGHSWTRHGEYGAFAKALQVAKAVSKGRGRAADVTKDGTRLAHCINGERTL